MRSYFAERVFFDSDVRAPPWDRQVRHIVRESNRWQSIESRLRARASNSRVFMNLLKSYEYVDVILSEMFRSPKQWIVRLFHTVRIRSIISELVETNVPPPSPSLWINLTRNVFWTNQREVKLKNLFLATCYILLFLSNLVARDKVYPDFSRIVVHQLPVKAGCCHEKQWYVTSNQSSISLKIAVAWNSSLNGFLLLPINSFKELIIGRRLKNERIVLGCCMMKYTT